MRTEIAVALIGAGAISVQIGANYLHNRQSANDLRVNIDREIDIIRKLRPDSPEATKLANHVSANINELISRDERRDRSSSLTWQLWPLWVASGLGYLLGIWLKHGVPEELRLLVQTFYWAFVVIATVMWGQWLWDVGKYLWWRTRLGVLQIRGWFKERKIAKLEKKVAESEQRAQVLVDAAQHLIDVTTAHKDAIINSIGQETWDYAEQHVKELDAVIKARPTPPEPPPKPT